MWFNIIQQRRNSDVIFERGSIMVKRNITSRRIELREFCVHARESPFNEIHALPIILSSGRLSG